MAIRLTSHMLNAQKIDFLFDLCFKPSNVGGGEPENWCERTNHPTKNGQQENPGKKAYRNLWLISIQIETNRTRMIWKYQPGYSQQSKKVVWEDFLLNLHPFQSLFCMTLNLNSRCWRKKIYETSFWNLSMRTYRFCKLINQKWTTDIHLDV